MHDLVALVVLAAVVYVAACGGIVRHVVAGLPRRRRAILFGQILVLVAVLWAGVTALDAVVPILPRPGAGSGTPPASGVVVLLLFFAAAIALGRVLARRQVRLGSARPGTDPGKGEETGS